MLSSYLFSEPCLRLFYREMVSFNFNVVHAYELSGHLNKIFIRCNSILDLANFVVDRHWFAACNKARTTCDAFVSQIFCHAISQASDQCTCHASWWRIIHSLRRCRWLKRASSDHLIWESDNIATIIAKCRTLRASLSSIKPLRDSFLPAREIA